MTIWWDALKTHSFTSVIFLPQMHTLHLTMRDIRQKLTERHSTEYQAYKVSHHECQAKTGELSQTERGLNSWKINAVCDLGLHPFFFSYEGYEPENWQKIEWVWGLGGSIVSVWFTFWFWRVAFYFTLT